MPTSTIPRNSERFGIAPAVTASPGSTAYAVSNGWMVSWDSFVGVLTITGNAACWEVASSDAGSLVMFYQPADSGQRTWFALR